MVETNYYGHEVQYQLLLKEGFKGWGAEALDRRMAGHRATLESLFLSPFFPGPGSNIKILELGSGAGDSLMPLAEKGYQVTGLEISPTAVEWGRKKLLSLDFEAQILVGNVAEKFPFEDKSFAAVIDSACLHCIIGGDRLKALSESYRVLRLGGFMLVSHMVNDPRELPATAYFDSVTRTQVLDGVSYRYMPKSETLADEIEKSGFKIVKQLVKENSWWDHAEFWCLKNTDFITV